MSTALFAFDRPEDARLAADRLHESGVPKGSVTLHLPDTSSRDRTVAAVDEQVTGGLLTNVSSLFGDVFEWGSLPIDTSPYAGAVRRGGAVVVVSATSVEQCSTVDRQMASLQPATGSGWFEQPGEAPPDSAP